MSKSKRHKKQNLEHKCIYRDLSINLFTTLLGTIIALLLMILGLLIAK